MDKVNRREVAFWAGIAGAVASLGALSYILWQHRKTQAAQQKQDVVLRALNAEMRAVEMLDDRLRNLELAQCASPHVRQNDMLRQALNCPMPRAPVASPPVAGVGAQVSASPMGPPPQVTNMPNYGFYGDGPAGLASSGGAGAIGMPAFAADGAVLSSDITMGPVPYK